MPLFSGVPYITETPAESMRAERPAARLYTSALQSGMAMRQNQQQFEAETDLRRKAAVAELKVKLAELDVRRRTTDTALNEVNLKAQEYPAFRSYMESASKIVDMDTLKSFPGPSFYNPEFQKAAETFITQKSSVISQEEQRKVLLQHYNNIDTYNTERIKTLNSLDKNTQFFMSKKLDAIKAKMRLADQTMDMDLFKQANDDIQNWNVELDNYAAGQGTGFPVREKPIDNFKSWLQQNYQKKAMP